MSRNYKPYTQPEIALICEMYKAGTALADIVKELLNRGYPLRTTTGIVGKAKAYGAVRPRFLSDDNLLAMDATVNTADEKYGKSNPFILAEIELAKHFVKINGVRHFKFDDGRIKPIRRISDWHEIIRIMNRKRKAEGRPQIEYVKEWVV